MSLIIEIHPHICLELFRTVLACKRCLICADFSPDSDQTTFSLEEVLLMLARSNSLKLKMSQWWICFLQSHSFWLLKILTLMDRSGVDYCDVFISCLDSHSDGTHSLHSFASKWWNATFLQIWWRNKHLHLGWPEDEHIFSIMSFLGKLWANIFGVKFNLTLIW